jgi:hypothetical protein
MAISEENGWVVAKPNDPLKAAEARMPRPLLEKFVQDAVKQGYVSIDTAADLCGSAPLGSDFDIVGSYAMYLVPDGTLEALGGSPDLLRLLGSLSPQERDQAQRDKLTLRVGDLGDKQRAIANLVVFNGFNSLEQYDKSSNSPMTDFLPDGLSDDMQLEITDVAQTTPFAQMDQVGGMSFTGGLPLDGLPYSLAVTQHPEWFPVINPTSIKSLGMGSQRTVAFHFVLDTKTVADEIQEQHRPKTLLSIDAFLASLPREQREKIEADVAVILDRQRKQSAGRTAPAPTPVTGGVKPPQSVAKY